MVLYIAVALPIQADNTLSSWTCGTDLMNVHDFVCSLDSSLLLHCAYKQLDIHQQHTGTIFLVCDMPDQALFHCSDPFEIQSWSCLGLVWSCLGFDSLCALPLLISRLWSSCQCQLRLCLHMGGSKHRRGGTPTWFAILHILPRWLQGLLIDKAEAWCRRQLDSSFPTGLNATYFSLG